MKSETNAFKALPNTDFLLQSIELEEAVSTFGNTAVKLMIREELSLFRSKISDNNQFAIDQALRDDFVEVFCGNVAKRLKNSSNTTLLPVINLTGTVVHTNLGRARLPKSAINAMTLVAGSASNLEYDLVSGKRGDRDSHLEKLLCEITGAESATIVNNNAAAVLLVLNTLASGSEAIISRGELVEIGGAFRIPDVMKSANSILKEVGTTNRTHLSDYESAIGTNTSVLMKVHTSNYEIKGFTNSVAESELGKLAHQRKLHFVSDLGSGTLIDLTRYGLPREPTVRKNLEEGADIVTFSGDKLLGGPQAGLIVGKKELVERIKRNPLKRALRVDKITIAALIEVLKLYMDPDRLVSRLPLLADLVRPIGEIDHLAGRLLPVFAEKLADVAEVSIEQCKSQIGSGALPLDLLESRALVLKPLAKRGETDARLQKLAKSFRSLSTPIIGRLHDGRLIFDLRCLENESQIVGLLKSLTLDY